MLRLFFACLLLAAVVVAQEAQPLTVLANGKPLTVTPVIRNGTTYYPVDDIVRSLGGKIFWDPTNKIYKINDHAVGIEPLYLGGHFYLPLESIASATGSAVTWDLAHNQVTMKGAGETRDPFQPPAGTSPAPEATPTSASSPSTPSQPRQVEEPSKTTTAWDATMDGRLPAGWQFPNPHLSPNPVESATPPPSHPKELVKTAKQMAKGNGEVFVPKTTQNAAFQLTVTNLEVVSSFKGYYQPRGGHVFAVVYLSQKNVSGQAQVYPGKLHLIDNEGHSYDAMDELSNFWPVIMRPYGINFGYLVYELPETVAPAQVVLTTVGNPPLSVNL